MEINTRNVFNVNSIMRQIVVILDNPVKIVLILMLILTIIFVGELIAEYIQRRYIKLKAVKVVDSIRDGENNPEEIVANSKLLNKQKNLLLEIVKHKKLSNQLRESLATSLLDNYERQLNVKIKRTELLVKLGPSFGLLGTLIPLGPGIIALASGDTATLSTSLLSAFDTTVIGLISGSICSVLSLIRRNWYQKDSIMLRLIMEAIVEKENENA